ncbi:MAG: hypothetical protein L0Z55_05490 [Planctomycetes bacterium]|nr:hypothetical protein [Planctomycetota bacterium]
MILLLQAPMWLPGCVETTTSIFNDLTRSPSVDVAVSPCHPATSALS